MVGPPTGLAKYFSSVVQVLVQCAKWCPQPEAVFSSVQAAQPNQPKQQSASPSAPQWGWDDLKFSAGDTLNPGAPLTQKASNPLKASRNLRCERSKNPCYCNGISSPHRRVTGHVEPSLVLHRAFQTVRRRLASMRVMHGTLHGSMRMFQPVLGCAQRLWAAPVASGRVASWGTLKSSV